MRTVFELDFSDPVLPVPMPLKQTIAVVVYL